MTAMTKQTATSGTSASLPENPASCRRRIIAAETGITQANAAMAANGETTTPAVMRAVSSPKLSQRCAVSLGHTIPSKADASPVNTTAASANHQNSEREARPENWKDLAKPVRMARAGPIPTP
nr:hypothetical protein [Rhodobacter sp. Har01]